MNMKECYESMGADYNDALDRLMNDAMIEKFLRKFADADYLEKVLEALEAEDWEAAFKGTHSMKGTAANLGLTRIYHSSSLLCEELRPCVKPEMDISDMVENVKAAVQEARDLVAQF